MDAVGEEVKVKMQYYSVHSQQKKTYTIHPYRLMYFRGGLYLFALVEEYKQIRTFAIERIEAIEKTRESFDKPQDFSRSEEHTSELQSRRDLVCRLLLEKKK